jgi:hypothetical protein
MQIHVMQRRSQRETNRGWVKGARGITAQGAKPCMPEPGTQRAAESPMGRKEINK